MRRRSDTLQPGDDAPDFTLTDTSGRPHALRDLFAGGKTLLLVFDRGTWWPNCRRRFGELQAHAPEYAGRGARLAVILAQRSRRAAQYLQEHPVGFPVLIDEGREVAKAYGVWHRLGLDALNIARPALFVIGADGTVRSIYVGESQREFPERQAVLADLPGNPPDDRS